MANIVPVDVFHSDWEESKRFTSLNAFAKFIKAPYGSLMWSARNNSKGKDKFAYKDYLITRLSSSCVQYNNRRKGCTIRCKDTDESFPSIKVAAMTLGVNTWKLDAAFKSKGFYEAADGKRYIKEKEFEQKGYNLENTIKEKVQELTRVDDTVVLKEVCKRFIEKRKYEVAFNIVEALQKIDQ